MTFDPVKITDIYQNLKGIYKVYIYLNKEWIEVKNEK